MGTAWKLEHALGSEHKVKMLMMWRPHTCLPWGVVQMDDCRTLFLELQLGWAGSIGEALWRNLPWSQRTRQYMLGRNKWAKEELFHYRVPYFCEQNCFELKPNHCSRHCLEMTLGTDINRTSRALNVPGIWGLTRRYPAINYEKQRHLLKKIQDTRNVVCRMMTPQSPSK